MLNIRNYQSWTDKFSVYIYMFTTKTRAFTDDLTRVIVIDSEMEIYPYICHQAFPPCWCIHILNLRAKVDLRLYHYCDRSLSPMFFTATSRIILIYQLQYLKSLYIW